MISQLRGTIIEKNASDLTIDVSGVGYSVRTPMTTLADLPPEGSQTTLHIHTHVREDQFSLFGFATAEEKNLFQTLLKVQGIGPKIALAVLSTLKPHQIEEAITAENASIISSVPGIGDKVAKRLIVELKGKIVVTKGVGSLISESSKLKEDILSALINLGYQRKESEECLKKIDWNKQLNLEDGLRAALKEIKR